MIKKHVFYIGGTMKRTLVALVALSVLAGLLAADQANAQTPVYKRAVQPRGMTSIGSGPNTTTLYYPQITTYTKSTFPLTDANGYQQMTGGTKLWSWTDSGGAFYYYYTYANIPIGFTFQYYENAYTNLNVGLAGLLFFSMPTYYYYIGTNYALGQSQYVHNFIAPYWDELMIYYYTGYAYTCGNCGQPYYTCCPYGEVRYQTTGAVGSRVLRVQWHRVTHYYAHYNYGWVSCEARLYEGTNRIEFVYENNAANGVNNFKCYALTYPSYQTYYSHSATIGLEASNGSTVCGGPNTGATNTHQSNNYRFDPVPPIVDDGSRSFTLPADWDASPIHASGFDFYAQRHLTVWVGNNGIVTFASDTNPNNAAIPSASTPNGYIALFWDDLKIDQIGTWDRINYTIQGAPGYRMCIIEFNKVTCKANTSLELTGQIVLCEVDNSVELRYDSSMPPWTGMSATIGIEDPTGTLGLGGPSQNNNINVLPANNYKFTPIYPPDNWSANPLSVPTNSSTGNFPVRWVNTTRAEWYELQEYVGTAAPGAGGPWTAVYGSPTDQAATALSYSAINKPDGTYWYQVKAWNIAGSNAWYISPNGCTVAHPPLPPVSLDVPFSDADGNYAVRWENSPSDTGSGITYELQYDSNPNFTNPTAISPPHTACGTAPYDWEHAINGMPNGTYYYRVRANKGAAGLSSWTYGTNGCTVQLPPPTDPTWIDVYSTWPGGTQITTDSDGDYYVVWGAATGQGSITYEVEEATNPQYMGALNVYSGAGLDVHLQLRSGLPPLGTQYYYRVRARNNSGWSNWVNDLNGVTVLIPAPTVPTGLDVRQDAGGVPGASITQDDNGDFWVTWNGVTGATRYMLQQSINNTVVGGSLVGAVTLYNGSGTQYHATGVGNGTYYFQVQAWNSSGSSPWSLWLTGLTVLLVPAAPTGLTVPSTDGDGVYAVSWNASPGSEGVLEYAIEEDDNPGFSSPTLLSAPEYTGGTSTVASIGAGTPRPNGTYYYRVRARNSSTANGGWGSWATGSNGCVVLHPPASPAGLEARNTPTGASITQDVDGDYYIVWPAVGSASSYELQEYQGPPAPGAGSTWVAMYIGSSTSFHIVNKSSGTFYYRVKAVNSSGSSGWVPVSPGVVSVEIIPPAAPVNIYLPVPPQSATGSYVISWDPSAGATTYELEESPNGTGSWVQVYSGAGCSHTVYGKTSGSYYYRVRGRNGAGPSTGWTYSNPTFVQIIAPNAPSAIIVPAHSISGYYTVSWSVSQGATGYTLEEALNPGFTGSSAVYTGTATSVYLTSRGTLGTPTVYYYRVRSYNVVGPSASWTTTPTNSCIVDLQAPQAPTAINVPTSSSTGTYPVMWTQMDGAMTYDLQESAAPDTGFAQAVTIYTGSATAYNVAGKTNGTYYYRVRATNVAGTSGWTTTPANSCVVDLQPPFPPGSFTVPLSSFTGVVALSWGIGQGALWYEVEEDRDSGFGSASLAHLGAGTSCVLYGRTPGTYYYRIRSVNTVGSSAWFGGSNPCMVSVVSAGLCIMAGRMNPVQGGELPNAADVPMLHLWVSCNAQSDVAISALTVSCSGSGDPNAEIQDAELWQDVDGDGRVSAGDVQMGSSQAFAPSAATVTFGGIVHTMTKGSEEDWLVVFTFSNALVGSTFGASMASNTQLSAVDITFGNTVVIEGAPVAGGTKTIQSSGPGDLGLHVGRMSPRNQQVKPGTGGAAVLQLALSAGSIDGARVTRVRFTAAGSGSDNGEVVNVALFDDADGNGQAGAGETLLGSGTYTVDNGMITMGGITSLTVSAGTVKHLLLTYDFASGISGSRTFAALVLTGGDVSATGVSSSQAISAQGAPVMGSYTTVSSDSQDSSGDDPDYSIGGCSAAAGTASPDLLGWLSPFAALFACALALRRRRT